jgi:hypothetical protein
MRFIMTATTDPSRAPAAADAPFDLRLVAAAMKYNEEMHKAGVLIASEGLNPAGQGASIGVVDGKRALIDGPFSETKELIGGFYLIEVKSREEAIEWAMRCPVGLGFDDVLTLHQMTDASDIPPEIMAIIAEAAPTWCASLAKRK